MRHKLIPIKVVVGMISVSDSTIYEWSRDLSHPFPKPVNISNGRKGLRWVEAEIEKYIAACIARRDKQSRDVDAAVRKALRIA